VEGNSRKRTQVGLLLSGMAFLVAEPEVVVVDWATVHAHLESLG